MKAPKLFENEVKVTPIEDNIPATMATFRYPKFRNNGPFIRPNDIPKAELIFMMNDMSAAGIFISANLSLNISPKFVINGAITIYVCKHDLSKL